MKEPLGNAGAISPNEQVALVDVDGDVFASDSLPAELRRRIGAATVEISAASVKADYERHLAAGQSPASALALCLADIEGIERDAAAELETETGMKR